MIKADLANKAMAAVEAKAREMNLSLTMAVVDEYGGLVFLKRMDGALVVSPDFARAKAYTSAVLMAPTAQIAQMVGEGKPYHGLTDLKGGDFTVIAGGIPVKADGRVVGAVGVGGSPDPAQDEVCAKEAAEFIQNNFAQ